jgi:hypothetical protein
MSDGMPIEHGPAEMFTLLDHDTVRLELPELPIAGRAEPLRIHLDFDADSVDEMIGRLIALRLQMLPAPQRN